MSEELFEVACECGSPMRVSQSAIDLGVMCDECAQWFCDVVDGKVKHFRVSEVAAKDAEISRLDEQGKMLAKFVDEKDAEISRLRAELERVRGQRDALAINLHNEQMGVFMAYPEWTKNAAKGRADARLARDHGLRIVGGKVEEIEK